MKFVNNRWVLILSTHSIFNLRTIYKAERGVLVRFWHKGKTRYQKVAVQKRSPAGTGGGEGLKVWQENVFRELKTVHGGRGRTPTARKKRQIF